MSVRPPSEPVSGRLLEGGALLQPHSIVAVGAHPDDIELGCGGSLSKWAREGASIHILVISAGADGGDAVARADEAAAAARLLGATITQMSLPSASLGQDFRSLLMAIETAIDDFDADLVLAHSPNDQHQDHRAVSEAAASAVRNFSASLLRYSHAICARGFEPDFYVDIRDDLSSKVALVACHETQAHRFYMQPDAIMTEARHRALQLRREGFFEAFEVARILG